MFLKRTLMLVVCVLGFIGFFLARANFQAADLEDKFHQERMKFDAEGAVLTAPEPKHDTTTVVVAPPEPTVSAPDAGTGASPSSTSSSSSSSSSDTGANGGMIIGPMAPSSSSASSSSSPSPTPDTEMPGPGTVTPTTSPAPPDTNSEPMLPPPPPSTMVYPHGAHLPLVGISMLAFLPTQAGTALIGQTSNTAPSTSAPATTESAAPARAVSPRAMPVETSSPAETAPESSSSDRGTRAIVLGFHQFTAAGVPSGNIYSMRQDIFEGEMKYLHDNGYNVVPLSQVVGFIEHKNSLPPNAVAITIDDGYKSAINYAAPVLKEFGYPWTFFVYPQFITRTESKGAASWPDLLELGKEGVDVECHSMTHPILDSHRQKFHGPTHTLTPEEYDQFLTDETSGAKAILERELGKPIKYFAYPYGRYNKEVEAKAIAAGFEAIFTVAGNPVHITTDIHRIGRYIITKPDEKSYTAFLHQGALGLTQVDPAPGSIVTDPRPVITATLGFTGDPNTLEAEVRGFGVVRHDFDPQTSTMRIYLPHDLIQPEVHVTVHAKDQHTGQNMVQSWDFNYNAPAGAAPAHEPIGTTPPTAPLAAPAVPPAVTTPTPAMPNPAPVSAPTPAPVAPGSPAAPAPTAPPATGVSGMPPGVAPTTTPLPPTASP